MAVYTEIPDCEIAPFLSSFNLGDVLALKGIAAGVENSNFLLSTTRGSYILTLYEKRVRRGDLPFFLKLMRHLSRKGLSCPSVIEDKKGNDLKDLCGKPAAITSFLEGMPLRKVETFHCRELGAAMAKLHEAGQDFDIKRENNLSLTGWKQLLENCRPEGDQIQAGLMAALDQEYRFLKENWPQYLPEGVIHADLFQDNVFFLNEKLSGLIDFYFACNDFLAYDLAICLNAWCFEAEGLFDPHKAMALLEGYESQRPLKKAEKETLPVLARGAALRFLLTRLYDSINHREGAFVQAKDPMDYVRRLSFHQKITQYSDYFKGTT